MLNIWFRVDTKHMPASLINKTSYLHPLKGIWTHLDHYLVAEFQQTKNIRKKRYEWIGRLEQWTEGSRGDLSKASKLSSSSKAKFAQNYSKCGKREKFEFFLSLLLLTFWSLCQSAVKNQRSQKQKILRRGGKNTQENYTKKILMTQITMMV